MSSASFYQWRSKYSGMASIEKITVFEKEFGGLLKKLVADGTEQVHIFCVTRSLFNFCMGPK